MENQLAISSKDEFGEKEMPPGKRLGEARRRHAAE
jgi:hypothetical protein